MSKTKNSETVKVMVRTRPMNQKEFDRGSTRIVQNITDVGQVSLMKPKSDDPPRNFFFDMVFGEDSLQNQVYNDCAFNLVENVIEGYNGTIFAYGQTGCGKSHTMMGPSHPQGHQYSDVNLRGVIPQAIRHIFQVIDSAEKDIKFLVRCSYLEIYNEKLLDLLAKQDKGDLQVKQDPNKGIFVPDLTNVITKSPEETEKMLYAGLENRKTGETAMNKDSSRSHSIFTIYVETAEDPKDGSNKQKIKVGKLNLVDLAGSERQSKTQAVGVRLDEAKAINLSLSALGNVIKALVDGVSTHIPYRDSKLTRLLQDSLGGNTKTVMVAALSPADYNYDETLSTLRYADRAKQIKNKPKINMDPKDALLKEYESEIKQLKEMLMAMQNSGASALQMNQAMVNMQASMKQQQNIAIEESVDDLVLKLQNKGKKIKIIEEGAEGDGDDLNDREGGMNKNMEELQKLEDEKTKLNQQNEIVKNELEMKEKMLQIEQQEKDQLESMINQMNQKLMEGGKKLNQQEKEQAKQVRQYQLELKKQKKNEQILMKEKQKKEREAQEAEQQFQDAQEELQGNREVIKRLKLKYQQALNEIKDIENEQQGEKEELLQTIRQQEHELKFFRQLTKMVMKDAELAKVRNKSSYDDDRDDWTLPPFILKAKEVTLPSLGLGKQKVMEQLEADKENRQIQFEDGDQQMMSQNNTQQQTLEIPNNDDDDDRPRGSRGFMRQYQENQQNSKQKSGSNMNGFDNGDGSYYNQQQNGDFEGGMRSQNNYSNQKMPPPKRGQSRGRVQINVPQKGQNNQQLGLPQNNGGGGGGGNTVEKLRWSQIDTKNSSSNINLNAVNGGGTNSSMNQYVYQTPEPLLKQNSKAMAQLAPIQNPTIIKNGGILSTPGQDLQHHESHQIRNIPSIEQLQNANKLQPLNHLPRMK